MDFPEGALIAHLHRVIELRDGVGLPLAERCSICKLSLINIYSSNEAMIEHHLITPLSELNASNRYKPDDFIEVCPNCHSALHHYRPWRNKENAMEIIKNI